MVEQGTTVVEQPKTEQQLMQEMQAALKSGDYKSVHKGAGELVKFQKAKEQLELEAKQKVLETKTLAVKAAITKALDRLISSGELDQADGIWYANDFGEKLVSCRLSKVAPKAKSVGGGGGTGKKFITTTVDMLAKHGNTEYKDRKTFKQAWDENTDKNWRYAIREALLKKEGIIS